MWCTSALAFVDNLLCFQTWNPFPLTNSLVSLAGQPLHKRGSGVMPIRDLYQRLRNDVHIQSTLRPINVRTEMKFIAWFRATCDVGS